MILNVHLETINRLLGIKNSKVIGNLIIERDIINESENEAIIDIRGRLMHEATGKRYNGIPILTEFYRGYYVYCKNCLRKIVEIDTCIYNKILGYLYDHELTKCLSCGVSIKNED